MTMDSDCRCEIFFFLSSILYSIKLKKILYFTFLIILFMIKNVLILFSIINFQKKTDQEINKIRTI